MASPKSAPKAVDNWQAEDDHRTLMRACEVMADKLRMRGAMAVASRQRRAMAKMEDMMAAHKRSGSLKKRGY